MTPGINTLLLSTGALGSFTCSGMTLLIYMGPTALRGIRATGDTLSNVESQVFTPYKFGSTAGDRTPDLLTTRPTCYHLNAVSEPCLYIAWFYRYEIHPRGPNVFFEMHVKIFQVNRRIKMISITSPLLCVNCRRKDSPTCI